MIEYEARLEALQKIYDSLPTIECKGLCWTSCGPIDMSSAERKRIIDLGVEIPVFTEEAGERWANNEHVDFCPAFSMGAQDGIKPGCTVYEARPLICRIWGVAETMECPFGCERSGLLSTLESFELLLRSEKIGGSPRPNSHDVSVFKRVLENPESAEVVNAYLSGDQTKRDQALRLLELAATDERTPHARRTP